MNKTKIEWCDSTWNPVTGCFHSCEYCYARKIANRFGTFETIDGNNIRILDTGSALNCAEVKNRTKTPYPLKFTPTLHRYRLDEPQRWTKSRTIFVCSMADLFGSWVPDEWIEQVFEACKAVSQHNYMFLTKNPKRYEDMRCENSLPKQDNFWYGSTITNSTTAFWSNEKYNTFLSIEPLLAPLGKPHVNAIRDIDWAIIGAETGNRPEKVIPEREWIDDAVSNLKDQNIPIFMKDSLIPIMGEENMLREFPEGLRKDKKND